VNIGGGVVVVVVVVVVYGWAAGLDKKLGRLFDMKLVDGTRLTCVNCDCAFGVCGVADAGW